jgi:hypothetical protein
MPLLELHFEIFSMWGCLHLARCLLRPIFKALSASSYRVVRIIGEVLHSYSFSLLSFSTLLIISSSIMFWRFSSSLPASQLLLSAIVGPDEPFSHSLAITFWRSEVRTLPSFSDSSGPVSALLPEDHGCDGHVCHNWTTSAHIKSTAIWKVVYRNVK